MNNIANHKAILRHAQQRSASYFFWVAGFTVVNTFLTLFTKANVSFAFALGVVDIANTVVGNTTIAIAFAAFMTAIFAMFGWFSRNGNVAVFITGMALYLLDGLLLLASRDWIGVAVHAYIIYQLYRGVQYSIALKKLIQKEEADLRQQRIAEASPGQL